MRWKEIKEKYPDSWVAISNFSDDPDPESIPNSQGDIFAVAKTEKELVDIVMKKGGDEIDLSIEYTGERLKNYPGGLWIIEESDSQETMV